MRITHSHFDELAPENFAHAREINLEHYQGCFNSKPSAILGATEETGAL